MHIQLGLSVQYMDKNWRRWRRGVEKNIFYRRGGK